jgi:hypothetical protein
MENRRTPTAAQKQSAVSSTSIRMSSFICVTSLLTDFARMQSRKLRVSHSRHVHQGFVAPFYGRNALFDLKSQGSGAIGRDAQTLVHVTGCPRKDEPWSCFHQSSGC